MGTGLASVINEDRHRRSPAGAGFRRRPASRIPLPPEGHNPARAAPASDRRPEENHDLAVQPFTKLPVILSQQVRQGRGNSRIRREFDGGLTGENTLAGRANNNLQGGSMQRGQTFAMRLAVPVISVVVVACSEISSPERAELNVGAAATTPCPDCVLGPVTVTRTTGLPNVLDREFTADPDFQYSLRVISSEWSGVVLTIRLNGHTLYLPRSSPGPLDAVVDIPVRGENRIEINMTGVPGRSVSIRVEPTKVYHRGIAVAETEDSKFPVLAGDRTGNLLALAAAGAPESSTITAAAFIAMNGTTAVVSVGPDGLPDRLVLNGVTYAFQTWEATSVEVIRFDELGEPEEPSIIALTQEGQEQLAELRAMAQAQPLGEAFNVSDMQVALTGTVLDNLKRGAFWLSVTACHIDRVLCGVGFLGDFVVAVAEKYLPEDLAIVRTTLYAMRNVLDGVLCTVGSIDGCVKALVTLVEPVMLEFEPTHLQYVSSPYVERPAGAVTWPAVRVLNGKYAPLSGVAVGWNVVMGGGRLATSRSYTAGGGVATNSWTIGVEGLQRIRATAGWINGLHLHFDASVQSPVPAGSWCDAFLPFDNNQIPTGWTVSLIRRGPGVTNNRLEARPIDSGAELVRSGSPHVGTSVVIVEWDGLLDWNYWGMDHGPLFVTNAGTYRLSVVTAEYNYGRNRVSLQLYHDATNTSTNTPPQPIAYGAYGFRVAITDAGAQWTLTPKAGGSPISVFQPTHGLQLSAVTGFRFRTYTTTDALTWSDNLRITCQ
jgi:hypothetical protein